MKTAVLTDSTAYIPEDVRKKWGIHMVPLSVIFGEESYQEEIDITAEEFYSKVKQSNELPKTSQPSIGMITDLFEELSKDYDAVISIHLSSGISGTYQAAVSAGNMVEGIEVYPFDSEISCMAQGFYVLEAAQMAREGRRPEAILSRLNEMKETMRGYFIVDDLTHLHRGGRLSAGQALVGSLLQVKPVLHFVDTKIVPFEKIRTKKKALKRILELLAEEAQKGKQIEACVIHANVPEEGEKLKKKIEEAHDHVHVTLSYFGPVIGTHLGEGALGICWYIK
ncbi:DegV family protein with EDD domain [Melghiribacillus thermohalophilus]|uniref:DegV family protein with EDD domain n=1 Tax=Melghiribacillus thermohalophilus TaxID=1324956 RepID=A0A4R3MVA9_9BACI|nr:DegV family protein [Melghiribacillus thermohalophilus]TCT20458.1 DegV family protein with EDD domain [Melghiribacillus thermohalophilus]